MVTVFPVECAKVRAEVGGLDHRAERKIMKRLAFAVTAMSITGGSALAADLPPPMAPPPRAPAMYVPVAPLYSWAGFYIGGNLGAAGIRAVASRTLLAALSRDRDRPPSLWAVARSA